MNDGRAGKPNLGRNLRSVPIRSGREPPLPARPRRNRSQASLLEGLYSVRDRGQAMMEDAPGGRLFSPTKHQFAGTNSRGKHALLTDAPDGAGKTRGRKTSEPGANGNRR